MKRYFVQWWLIVLAFATMLFWAAYFGAVQEILTHDVTRFTVATAVVFVLATIFIGYQTYILSDQNYKDVDHRLEIGWFASDVCMSLGLIGTVIGFIMMMNTQIAGANASDPTQMMQMIGHIMTSLGTALYTTAVGISAGTMLKVLCFNTSHAIGVYRNEDW